MPGARNETRSRAAPASRTDGQVGIARSAAPNVGGRTGQSAPRPENARTGTRGDHAKHRMPDGPEAGLQDLFRGLRAGDLESLLLTVEMAAEENRMPSADPDEAERILTFLGRLAEYDPALPSDPGGADARPQGPLDVV